MIRKDRGIAIVVTIASAACGTSERAIAPGLDAVVVAPAIELAGSPSLLGLPPGYLSGLSAAINNQSVVAGSAYRAVGSEPFVWTAAGGFRRLPTVASLPFGSVRAINNKGVMVGVMYNPPSSAAPAVWFPDAARVQLIPGFALTSNPTAHAINDEGQIAGQGALISDPSVSVAYRYSLTRGLEVMPTLGGRAAAAYAISAAGALAGQATTADGLWHPTLWTPQNTPIALAETGAYYDFPRAINSQGMVAGYSFELNADERPLLWRTPSQVTVLPLPSGATGAAANAIDEAGRVYGWAFLPAGRVGVVWSSNGRPQILPASPLDPEAIPEDVSTCGKIAGRGTTGWIIWDRVC